MELERIHEMLEQIRKEVMKAFPKATNADFRVCADGYMNLSVETVEKTRDLPVEGWKRRELMDQNKFSDTEWSADRSAEQNAYYKRHNLLLEEA